MVPRCLVTRALGNPKNGLLFLRASVPYRLIQTPVIWTLQGLLGGYTGLVPCTRSLDLVESDKSYQGS